MSSTLRVRLRGAPAGVVIALALAGGTARADTSTTTVATATTPASLEDAALAAEIAGAIGADQDPAAASTASSSGGVLGALQAMMPDLAFVLDVALAGFSTDAHLQTGGHDPTANGFNLQQLELSASSKVDVYFQLDANIVFSQFGVEVEEAYVTTLDLPAHLQIRAGQFLTRFGRINATHPHAWDFVDQPFAIGRVFGGEGNRGLGLEVSWLTPLPWFAEVLASTTMAGGEGTARSFYGAEDLGVRSPLDLQATVALEQFFPLSDDLSLLLGLSGATGPNASGRDNRTDVFGVDAYLRFRPVTYQSSLVVTLQSEWLYRRRQVPRALLEDLTGYAQALVRFAERWAVAGRFELGTPASAPDPLDPEWTSTRHRTALALTFWPTEFSRLRLQGSLDVPTWRDEPVWAVFLAGEFVIGAHGAHAF